MKHKKTSFLGKEERNRKEGEGKMMGMGGRKKRARWSWHIGRKATVRIIYVVMLNSPIFFLFYR